MPIYDTDKMIADHVLVIENSIERYKLGQIPVTVLADVLTGHARMIEGILSASKIIYNLGG